mgnify:CR=1 FL=1
MGAPAETSPKLACLDDLFISERKNSFTKTDGNGAWSCGNEEKRAFNCFISCQRANAGATAESYWHVSRDKGEEEETAVVAYCNLLFFCTHVYLYSHQCTYLQIYRRNYFISMNVMSESIRTFLGRGAGAGDSIMKRDLSRSTSTLNRQQNRP